MSEDPWDNLPPGAELGDHYGLVLSVEAFRRLADKTTEIGPPPVTVGVDWGKGDVLVISQAQADGFRRMYLQDFQPEEIRVEDVARAEPCREEPYYRRFERNRRKGRKG